MPKFEKKLEVVEAWRTKGNRTVQTANGPMKAQPGQWIVVVGDGLYELLSDADFREKYEAKDKDAEKALKATLKTPEQEAADAQKKAEADAKKEAEEMKAEAEKEAKEKAEAEKEAAKKAAAEAKAMEKEKAEAKKQAEAKAKAEADKKAAAEAAGKKTKKDEDK